MTDFVWDNLQLLSLDLTPGLLLEIIEAASIAALIVTLQPILTNILSGPILNEKVTLKQWIGVLLGFFGATLVLGLDVGSKIPLLGLVATIIALISITGQGDGTWLIDKEGNPVCDAWLWLDARSSEIAKGLTNLESENSRFNATGTAIFAGQQSAQISYMEKNNPEILNKSTTAFHCKDWIY